jgi:hypothetical protein
VSVVVVDVVGSGNGSDATQEVCKVLLKLLFLKEFLLLHMMRMIVAVTERAGGRGGGTGRGNGIWSHFVNRSFQFLCFSRGLRVLFVVVVSQQAVKKAK